MVSAIAIPPTPDFSNPRFRRLSPIQRFTSPAEVLSELSLEGKRSGRLTIQSTDYPTICWQVYLIKGNIHFATTTVGGRDRLSYLCQRYRLDLAPVDFPENASDYEVLLQAHQSGQLSEEMLHQFLLVSTQEALVQIWSLPPAATQFEPIIGLDPQFLSVSLTHLVAPLTPLVEQWRQVRPVIPSPFHRPYIQDVELLMQMWQLQRDRQSPINALTQTLAHHHCIYEIAQHLQVDALAFSSFLQPFVHTGALGLLPY